MPWATYSDYFTEKFWKDHVLEGSAFSKKNAEETFQRRNVNVSTMIEGDALAALVGEIIKHRRTDSYAGSPLGEFITENRYYFWERAGKRAKRLGPFQFKYGLKYEDGLYKIHHFAGIA